MQPLTTNRLLLRPLEETDAPAVLELWSKPLANCFVPDRLDTLEQAKRYIKETDSSYDFAVCLQETGDFIGMLFGQFEEPDTFSPCWNFLPQYFGHGYATESVSAYFSYLFDQKRMRRLYAFVEEDNIASQRVCQEGLFEDFSSFVNNPDGSPKYENTYQYAILKKEWQDMQ